MSWNTEIVWNAKENEKNEYKHVRRCYFLWKQKFTYLCKMMFKSRGNAQSGCRLVSEDETFGNLAETNDEIWKKCKVLDFSAKYKS